MNFTNMSNPNVISSGRAQLASLQNNSYLHNIKGNYDEIGGSFSPVDISMMDAIGNKIIQAQKIREQQIYNMLGIKNIEELNEKYLEAGGNRDLLNTSITKVLNIAAHRAFGNSKGMTRNKSREGNLSSAVKEVLDDMVDEEYKDKKEVAELLKVGLGETAAHMLLQANSKKEKPRSMERYVNKLSNQIGVRWRGQILEEETAAVMQQVVQQLIGKHGNVTVTGAVINAYGKQIKSDVTMQLNESVDVGISAKNYKLDSNGDVEFTAHSAGSLENFYKLVEEMNGRSLGAVDLVGIKNLINSFRTPYFKYHLINQAAFYGSKKRIEQTRAGKNIIDFIKTCLPLFIGAQMKIKGDEVNVDFFNISGKLVPISIILEEVFYGKRASTRIGLYSNYSIPWVKMREAKMRVPVENGEFYSEETQRIGGMYGEQVYTNIKTGRIHLKIALSSF